MLPLLLGYHSAAQAHPSAHKRDAKPRGPPPARSLHPRSRIIHTLLAQVGKPYRWGGISPHTGFDCSGFIYYTWHKNFNIRLPRTAKGMYAMPQAQPVKLHQLEPGDIVFFSMHGDSIDHVGVYLGSGHIIEAPHTGQNVKIVSMDKENYRQHYRGSSATTHNRTRKRGMSPPAINKNGGERRGKPWAVVLFARPAVTKANLRR